MGGRGGQGKLRGGGNSNKAGCGILCKGREGGRGGEGVNATMVEVK